jgi:hypothetical protein
VYAIELQDERLLASVADFLAYKLPGTVTRSPGRIEIRLEGVRGQEQKLVLQRMLLAWQREHRMRLPPSIRLVRVPEHATSRPTVHLS